MATHLSIIAWGNPKDRGTWHATVFGVARVRHNLQIKPPKPPQRIKAVLCYSLEGRDGVRGGREAQEGGGVCILMADSRCCMEEASTIV